MHSFKAKKLTKMELYKPLKMLVFLTMVVIVMNQSLSMASQTPSKHFVLVHGACHGAWSWFKLVPLLTAYGYKVTTLDLAGNGINPRPITTFRSITDYFRPLIQLMASLPPSEKVILVGHSYGGYAISQAMETFPHKIHLAIFLTANMPGPTLNISTLLQESNRRVGDEQDNRFIYGDGPQTPPTAFIFGPMYLKSRLYQLSPIQDLVLATILMRPTPLFTQTDLSLGKLIFTHEKYGSVKRAYIICEKDLAIERDFQIWMIGRNPPNLVKEILGSDHMVMMSNVFQLFKTLTQIVEVAKYL